MAARGPARAKINQRSDYAKMSSLPFKYRPEIDGLRALAVIPVVLFHAGLGFPGGFCGVDVFFVISGFLITSLIMKDLHAGRFSALTFWERRARRILPAGIAVMLAVLLAGVWLLLPEDAERMAGSVKWQAMFAANIYFKQTINYFSGAAEEMPLLHTWSLAVEEQFYAIAPFALYLLFLLWQRTKRVSFPWLIALAAFASFAYSVLKVERDPSGAFYLLPSRAWEMLLGSWVAVAPRPSFSSSSGIGRGLAFTGIAGILAAYFFYEESTKFPGLAAFLPCAGAAMYIWASSTPSSNPERPGFDVAHWLSHRAIVFVGLISYSLYLWHWPLIAFSNYWLLFDQLPWLRVGVPIASFVVAYLSWRYIETPFREKRCLPERAGMLAASAAAILVVLLGGQYLKTIHGFEARLTGATSKLITEKKERADRNGSMRELSLADVQARRFLRFPGSTDNHRRVFVWGDSHARAALPGVITAAKQQQITVLAAWHGATPPLIHYASASPFSLGERSPAFNQCVLDYIIQNHIEDVVLAGYWKNYLSGEPEEKAANEVFAKELAAVIARLTAAGCRVLVLLDWPAHRMKIPRLIFGQYSLGMDLTDFICLEPEHQASTRPMRAIVPQLERAGARIVDPTDLFRDEASGGYAVEDDGYPLYYDTNHLSVRGANRLAKVLVPCFADSKSPVLASADPLPGR
ncbi:MAG TPA: acyltransferase family protein [Lacunisphaera sp.]